jgi:glutathione synthase/RimK-type ligase-like ATP-grasp enzyme
MAKFLLTDLKYRKTFDIYNIINKMDDIEIVVNKPTLLQRFIYRSVTPLSFNSFSDIYKEKIIFFPIEEQSVLDFYSYLNEKKYNKTMFLLPEERFFHLVRDKKVFSSFCSENGFPVPKEYDLTNLENENFKYPMILKPRIGSGSVGIKHIESKDDLIYLNNISSSDYLLQEKISHSSRVFGAFFLFNHGEMVSYYGHRRLRTYPENGGVTVFSKCEINNDVKIIGIALLEKLNWHGIAMVEFLYDEKTNGYKIIEVNPRAWGSIMLSEYCGSNIIENYIRLSLGKEPISSNIKEDKYIRWIFPWDIILYIKSKGGIAGFWNINVKNTCYINFTYSKWHRSILFLIYNISKFKKIIVRK